MSTLTIDHIVISVTNFKKSILFYTSFLGKAKITKWDAHWVVGETKLFLTFPYKKKVRKFDKHNPGLNHLAFKVGTVKALGKWGDVLDKAKIKHSGIKIDKYSKKEFLWFDDPDGIRLEFYLRHE